MKKEKKASRYHESLTIKQAQNKNFGLEEHMKLIAKIYEHEKVRRAEEIEKERKRIAREIRQTRKIFPLPGYALNNLHRRRAKDVNDMCMHVVSCYMLRQEKNKRKWYKQQNEGHLLYRPLHTPDHLMFIKDKFPETYDNVIELGYTFQHNAKADIYEYGRAAHDMNCFSTRVKPVGETMGAYPKKECVNVRFWQPEPGDLGEVAKEVWKRRVESPPKQRKKQQPKLPPLHYTEEEDNDNNNIIRVPSLGFVEVAKDGVYKVEDGVAGTTESEHETTRKTKRIRKLKGNYQSKQ